MINKTTLELLLQHKYTLFGPTFITIFLDSLKNLGYIISTSAGISISENDLKIPFLKNLILKTSSFDLNNIELMWQNGKISEIEKSDYINTHWENISTSMKDTLLAYYKTTNCLNIVYIMAFSGARGNVSQLKQMTGIRGLMVNQNGDLISIPVLNNFKEGLNILDYIISSYGARKGVIDTALKTAEAGYLTRKLVYLVQDIQIKDKKCTSKNSLLITIQDDLFLNLIGKTIISLKSTNYNFKNTINLILTEKIINYFLVKSKFIKYIEIKSPITCTFFNSICQTCYGWDLTKKKKISLGDAVGIISAQTAGEPATQMTMRTFHIGGIFLGENIQYFIAKNSGKLKFLKKKKLITIQNMFGLNLYFLPIKNIFYFINWQNNKKILYSRFYIFTYLFNFFKKTEPIFEEKISLFSIFLTKSIYLHPIYSEIYGYLKILKIYKKYEFIKNIFFKHVLINKYIKFKNLILTMFDNYSYQINCYFLNFPLNLKFNFYENKKKIFKFKKINIDFFKFKNFFFRKSIGKLKITSTITGMLLKNKFRIYIKKNIFNYKKLHLILKINYLLIFHFFLSKIQYIDKKTILFNIYLLH